MAPSAISVEPTTNIGTPKSCKGQAVESEQVERTLAAVEQHISSLARGVHATTNTNLDHDYKIVEKPIGTRRPIRVACMGAGYSGLMMAIVFAEKMKDKNAELVVYERNEDLGGTWLENRYISDIHSFRSLKASMLICIDIQVANVTYLPITMPSALHPTQTGQTTTQLRNKFMNICTMLLTDTNAIASLSTSTQSNQRSGMRIMESGLFRF